MKLTDKLKEAIDNTILFWLATSSEENIPNVSPKEIVTYFGEEFIIIANIASPQTVKNIKINKNVCISFIDVLVQKGFQVKGLAFIVDVFDEDFMLMNNELQKMTEGKFPFATITKIKIESIKPILAPKYILYPETTEEEQIQSAKKAYKI